MTFEEVIALAENGDIGAMISLGDYYIHHEDEEERFEKAAEWYEMAAKHDVVMDILIQVIFLISGKSLVNFLVQMEPIHSISQGRI